MFFFLEALFVSETGSDLTYLGYFLGSPMIDLEVMGLRLTAPAEIRSATPTRQHVEFCFGVRISDYPVALIEICLGIALPNQFLE
jgi:hypothetical protein